METWSAIVAGVKFIPSIVAKVKEWWRFNRPAGKVLEGIIDNNQDFRIFVKDLMVPDNTVQNPKLCSKEGRFTQDNPNIEKVWPDVEAKSVARILNLLGRMGKKDKLEIIEMSGGYDMWDSNMIILGAQSIKSLEFYKIMENVGYSMDYDEIYDNEKDIVERGSGYGYGLIIKAKNTKLKEGKEGIAILLGGYGTLGTEAAVYYFCNNIAQLGKEFKNKYFSIIVRARDGSVQSVERLKKFDKITDK